MQTEEQTLDPARHDRAGFRCGVDALDEYLHRLAAQQSKKGLAVVRVLVDPRAPQEILGYYCLSAAQVDSLQLDERTQQRLPRYPVPCFRMGRFAVHSSHQGKGIGKLLIGCAMRRCVEARTHVGAFALIVDAKDAAASAFYQKYGFLACQDDPMRLYLPL